MAAIDTISGITLVTGTDREYEISSDVSIGSAIDDPPPYSIFTVISGGRYRFTAGCNTTFDRCTFIERDASTVYANNNYQTGSAADCRFSGGATCAPIFKGCKFIQEDGLARSDWDINQDGAAPTFEASSDGAQCIIAIYDAASVDQFNHFASSNIVIDGLIIDVLRGGGTMEMIIPPTITQLEIVDNAPGDGARHLVVLLNLWGVGATYYINGLNARNVATWEGPNTGETLVLRDPIGNMMRSTDFAAQRGIMQVERTYSVEAQNALTLANINPTIVITATSDNDVRYDEALVSGEFSNYLFQYEYRYNTTAVDPETKFSDDEYRRALVLWAFNPAVKTFTLDYDAASPSGTDDGILFFFAKAGVTEALQSTVDAYTALETTTKLFDAIHRHEIVRTDRHNVGTVLVEGIGATMDIQANNLVITNALIGGYPLTYSGTTLTCYTEASAFTLGAFSTITTTGTVTFSQANTFPDNITIDGDAVLSAVTDADGFSVTGTLDLATAGTYNWSDLDAGAINELTNSSGGAITININAVNAVTTNTGPNITLVGAVPTYTFNSDTASTLIRYFEDDLQTIVDSATGVTLDYEYPDTDPVDVEFVKQAYVPVNRQNIVPTDGGALDIQMDFDEAYNSSHGLTITTEFDYTRATKILAINSDQSALDVRSALADTIRTNASYYNTPLLMVAIPGLTRVDLINGASITSMATWKGAGMERFDAADSSNPTEKWLAVKSVGSITGASAYYRQTSSGSATSVTLTNNVIDEAFQYWSDPNHDGSAADGYDYSDYMVIKTFLAGSKQGRIDVFDSSGLAALNSNLFTVPLVNTSHSYAGTDPGISADLTVVAGSTVGGVAFAYEIVDGGTNTGTDIADQLHYNALTTPNGTVPGGTGLTWWELPDMVIYNATSVETERGYREGATPALVGFYVSRSAADHPDFTRFQGDNGTYYTPAVTANATGTNIPDDIGGDTKLQIVNLSALSASAWQASTAYSEGDIRIRTTGLGTESTAGLFFRCITSGTSGGTEPTWVITTPGVFGTAGSETADNTVTWECFAVLLYDADPASTGWSDTYNDGEEFAGGETARITFAHMNAGTSFELGRTTAAATSSGFSFDGSLFVDADSVFATNGVDGSTRTEFTADYTDTEIDVSSDTDSTPENLYAWYCYNLTTSEGMYRFWGAITAIDTGNYRNNASIASLKIDNTTTGSVSLQGSGARLFRDDGVNPEKIPTTSGFGVSITWELPVYAFDGGGGGYSSADRARDDAVKAKTDSLNFTVAGEVNANARYMNDAQVQGVGSTGDKWRGV